MSDRGILFSAPMVLALLAGTKTQTRRYGESYCAGYAKLWESINGAGSWTANPWVVATTFTVHKHNIDLEEK